MAKKKEKKLPVKAMKEKVEKKSSSPMLWDPYNSMEAMDKYFRDDFWTLFLRRPQWGSFLMRDPWYENWLDSETKVTAVDMNDTGKSYRITAEMPGVSKKDVEVSVTPNTIRICGQTHSEVDDEDEGWIRRERSYSTLCRTMSFPEEVNPNDAEATLKDGILEIVVAKKSPKEGKIIPIK
jgi:HSP20 family protein